MVSGWSQRPALPTIDELFDGYRSYAWRQETLDVFNVGEDSKITDWLAGRPAVEEEKAEEWHAMTRANKEMGRPVSRVRLVGHPITLYTAWEVHAYRENIAAGEEVRILDRNRIADDLNPLWSHDYWLFDDHFVWIMFYDRTGRFRSGTVSDDVAQFVEHRQRAIEMSVPHSDYSLPAL
ncbi:DUF6879 family protein [Amycolatopsis sp. NPDC004079]|uniref:DUF6879 family protein n=1 Tax=Amycolatopsis sp. NPDC004079 TaxID=3154549 RepID=UPI00339FAA39